MDLDTGDSFEHTERHAHPNAVENFQLQNAYAAFVAARARNMTPSEALATLKQHTICALTCDGMEQPVRAPDNLLYEADALIRALKTWKCASPLTRAPFSAHTVLTVDRRMQQLSAACGTVITPARLKRLHHTIDITPFAPDLEAMEAGRAPAPASASHWYDNMTRNVVCAAQGTFTALVLRAWGADAGWSCAGGLALFVGAMALPPHVYRTPWTRPVAT